MGTTRLLSCLFIAAGIALLGCGGNPGNAQQQIGFSTLLKGEVPPRDDNPAEARVIRTEAEWAKFRNRLYADQLPQPVSPSVDFSKNSLVAVVDTPRPTGGHAITISNIQPTLSGVIVQTSQISPGPGCIVTQAFTQPFHIVLTPLFSGVATLELSPSVLDCGE